MTPADNRAAAADGNGNTAEFSSPATRPVKLFLPLAHGSRGSHPGRQGRPNRWVTLAVAALLPLLLLAAGRSLSSVQAEPATGWQAVGQIGGPTSAVAVEGSYAYVGLGLRLVVLEVSDPAAPVELGATMPFPHLVQGVAVSDSLVYVAAGGAGLRVVDVADPVHPIELGAWDSPGYAEGVAVGDRDGHPYAFLADGPYGLRVVDVADPANPVPVGAAYDMNDALAVALAGDHAYLAAAGAGLLVADVSDPTQPIEAGQLDTPGFAYGVDLAGATAYVADAWGGLQVIDVSDPASPNLRGALAAPGWALDVAVEGETAYLAAGAGGLRLVDVSDPADPQEIAALEVGALARRVAVHGGTVYLADLTEGLFQVDVTAPQGPAEVGRYRPLSEARYVAVAGDYAYVAAGFSGLRVVDVSDPARPREVAAYATGDAYATGVVVSGTVAYVATYISGLSPHDLYLVDIADPLHPAGLATVDTDGVFREIAVQGTVLYAADEHGLRLIDVSDPAAPAEIGFVLIAGEQDNATIGVTVDGDLAYVAVAQMGLYIFDVTTPSDPLPVGVYDPPGDVNSVAVSAGRAYLGVGFDGLRLVDVSAPAAPVELGHLDTPGYGMAVVVSGNRAYLSDSGGGVQEVDVSDPATPVLASSYDTRGSAWQAALAGDHLYVADSRGGLVILEPAAPLAATAGPALPTALATGGGPTPAARPATPPGPTAAAPGAVCQVTSPADSGAGTLRWCLANALAGDSITFDPAVFSPADPLTITLLAPLPPLTQGQLTVDASDAGVILDGRETPPGTSGLLVQSDGNAVKGLEVTGFPATGIAIAGEARFNQIGGQRSQGSGPIGEGNRLSGNGDANLSIGGTGAMSNTVLGNLIGTNLAGTAPVENVNGVAIGGGASHNTIGGASLADANLIAGSLDNCLSISGPGSDYNVVRYNLIGTDLSGTGVLGPVPGGWTTGVHLHSGARHNVIGPGNVINATINAGVQLFGGGTNENVLIGNLIGTDSSGSRPLGNLGHGVVLNSGPQANTVGPGNRIAYNGGAGVMVQGADTLSNTISANAIYANHGPGIALSDGGNGGLPAPELTSVSPTRVGGSAPAGSTVEVFSGPDEEGQTHEGSATATSSGAFTFTQPAGLVGPLVTATATDPAGNTSAFCAPAVLYSATLTVTSPLDSGPGTLRQALLEAAGGDAIRFAPGVFDPQNPLTITLLADLPPLTQGHLTVDASRAGVILAGQLITDSFCGLWLASDANTVRGLQLVGFKSVALCVDGRHNTVGGDRGRGSGPTGQGNQFGVNYIAAAIGGDQNTFLGNLVGTDVTGRAPMANTVGVGVHGEANRIGGPTPGERNIISGNRFRGVMILGERARLNVVAGNYIGTDITGLVGLPNLNGIGLEGRASCNTVGGDSPAGRNLISGNAEKGVLLSDAGSHNAIIGNWIGLDASGAAALGNTHGIFIGGVGFNRIGGTAPGEGNVISGNGAAVDIATLEYTDNLILGNLIGLTADGSGPLGNGIGVGFHVNTQRLFLGGATPAEGNTIGGNQIGVRASVAGTEHNWILGNAIGTDAAGARQLGNSEVGVLLEGSAAHTLIQGNTVAYNGSWGAARTAGVYISRSLYNTIRRNAIYGNTGLGIHLVDGGNDLLPAPVITAAAETGVAGVACPGCAVELFADAGDEGRVYQGNCRADGSGVFSYSQASPLDGPTLTATATDGQGNTSGFSAPWALRPAVYLPLVLKDRP